MSDLFNQVQEGHDPITELLSKIPGFKGYIERQDRRASDKLLREEIARHYTKLESEVSALQRDAISQGGIEYVDDLEAAAIKLRQFVDRVRTASYGYSPLFDAVKINQDELATMYEYDLALLNQAETVQAAIDNVASSFGTDGLAASIRHLTRTAQDAVDAFNQRASIILGGEQSQ
ncbi:MAG: hypothetical protein JW750_12050 [Anaerolineaceae bacterium]|nr:hypothetical protein [Anaerolineaceae bacterium]